MFQNICKLKHHLNLTLSLEHKAELGTQPSNNDYHQNESLSTIYNFKTKKLTQCKVLLSIPKTYNQGLSYCVPPALPPSSTIRLESATGLTYQTNNI